VLIGGIPHKSGSRYRDKVLGANVRAPDDRAWTMAGLDA
jgi:hypothetical protein